jgi:DNA invertase Pin-like site-specific DNA recombinase
VTRKATKTQRRAVGYVRISALMGRTQGEDLLSDVIQRDKVKAWCDFHDVELVGFYEDVDRSGRRGVKRPDFDRMLADARAGHFDVAVVYKFDRLARSVIDAANAIEDLAAHGVGFVSATEQIDTTTAAGRMLVTILFAVAEMQSERISEDWRNAHEQRRKRGEAHLASGLLGYDTRREQPDGSKVKGARIVGVNLDEAAAVRLAFEMRAEGFGPGAIRDRLHDEGFRPSRGGEWFAASTLTQMLRNPTYAGLLRMPDGELVRAPHEPIVPLDLWERVQNRPKQPVRPRRASSDTSFLVGVVFCSGCGTRMKFQRRGDRPPVFRCWARQRSGSCPTPGQSILARRLEEYVVEQLLLDRATFERHQAEAVTRDAETAQRLRARDGEIARMIERLTSRIARTDDERVAEQYDRQVRSLVAERGTIGELLAELTTDAASARMPSRAVWVSLTLDEQRVLIRGLVRRLEVSKSAVHGGSHRRGIDFAQRVRVVLGWESSSAWAAVERVFDGDDELFARTLDGLKEAAASGGPLVL